MWTGTVEWLEADRFGLWVRWWWTEIRSFGRWHRFVRNGPYVGGGGSFQRWCMIGARVACGCA